MFCSKYCQSLATSNSHFMPLLWIVPRKSASSSQAIQETSEYLKAQCLVNTEGGAGLSNSVFPSGF